MGICIKKSSLRKSKIKSNINIIESIKNNNGNIYLNRNNDNKNEIGDKYYDKSALLNLKINKLNKNNLFEKKVENTNRAFNLKISIKSQ